MKHLHTILLSIGLVAVSLLHAQVYTCDFESATERQEWHLNPIAKQVNLENRWYIGKPGNCGIVDTKSSYGLYISSDADSANAVYTATGAMFTLAYRDMDMLAANTKYTITFDYRLGGSDGAKMSVYWLPTSVDIASYTSSAPSYDKQGGILIASDLRGKKVWESYKYTFTTLSSPGRLLFVWASSAGNSNPPSACVDNINIYSGESTCPSRPDNMLYARGTVTWQGDATQYEVSMYDSNTDTFEDIQTVNTASWTPNPSSEGMRYLYVRSVCASGECSPWAYISAFVYQKGARCIDFYDIGEDPEKNTGVCYVGNFKAFFPEKGNNKEDDNPYYNYTVITRQRVDFGCDSAQSMHTIHYIDKIDPNTAKIDGGLHTIPQGEIASVRLGAYTDNGLSARIEYKYHVERGTSDLLELKYAAVLQSGGHSIEQTADTMQPAFQLEVVDGQGNPLSDCTHFFFMPGDDHTTSDQWHHSKSDLPQKPNDENGAVYWCDWRTVTVSLRDVLSKPMGDTITIRLTTTRCFFNTHYAYAYFTLGCRSGELQNVTCGETPNTLVAPEGFDYRWYKASDPDKTIGNDSTQGNTYAVGNVLHIAQTDADIYEVEVISKMDKNCSYTLVANPNPRIPVAKIDSAVPQVRDCKNFVTFYNSSYVAYRNRVDTTILTPSDEPLQEMRLCFGDGKDSVFTGSEITYQYPDTGGIYVPRIYVSMSNGGCQDSDSLELSLPNLPSAYIDSIDDYCINRGKYPLPAGYQETSDSTLYIRERTNEYGCEIVDSIRVRFHSDTILTQTICEGGRAIDEKIYIDSGTYNIPLGKTCWECDSSLILTVLPQLRVEVPDTLTTTCSNRDSLFLSYDRMGGRLSQIEIRFLQKGVDAGFDSLYTCEVEDGADKGVVQIPVPKDLRPDNYEALVDFGTPYCPAEPKQMVVQVYYDSLVIEQKENLISLLNEQYNGGFEWTEYQWYCNDTLVPGAETSYIVVDDSHIGNEFYCLLLRTDGALIPTCPITYVGGKTALQHTHGQVAVYPTLLRKGESIHVSGAKTVKLVDIIGRVVATYQLPAYMVSIIPSPTETGVYTLITESDVIKIIVQ